MSRKLWIALFGGLTLGAAATPLWAPPLLRQIPWFGVRRVEISGTRLLAPHQVLAASGIAPGQNVWLDRARWEAPLLAHPAVASAKVSRRFPRTLRVRIEEKRPVAFVEAGALAPISANGELLPVDPARIWMDLPVIRGDWAGIAAPLRGRLLAEADRLGRLDPALLADVSEIRSWEGDEEVLLLSHSLAEIVLPAGTGSGRLTQLRAVLADLERRLSVAEPGAGRAQVDLRFGEQVVVRLPSSV